MPHHLGGRKHWLAYTVHLSRFRWVQTSGREGCRWNSSAELRPWLWPWSLYGFLCPLPRSSCFFTVQSSQTLRVLVTFMWLWETPRAIRTIGEKRVDVSLHFQVKDHREEETGPAWQEVKQKPCWTLIIGFIISHLSFTAKAQEPMGHVTHSGLGFTTSSSTKNPALRYGQRPIWSRQFLDWISILPVSSQQ